MAECDTIGKHPAYQRIAGNFPAKCKADSLRLQRNQRTVIAMKAGFSNIPSRPRADWNSRGTSRQRAGRRARQAVTSGTSRRQLGSITHPKADRWLGRDAGAKVGAKT